MVPSFDSNIRFVHFRAKGARARVYYPATYFLYFIAELLEFLVVFCEYQER